LPLYDAFISYSHAKDKPIAAALQSVIQKLGKPWYRRRALRVFRDDTSLSATPSLWPSIEQALGESRFLVLLASPEAASSPWVDKEVSFWLTSKSAQTLLIALTEGELAWDNASGDFLWRDGTPLPPALKGRFAVEPKWVDLRAYRDGDRDGANPRNARFIEAGADLAAAIRGMPKEDLLSQEVRQQRRAVNLALSAAASLLVLAGLAGWQWTVATEQRDRAERTLEAATQTANGLVFDLAQQLRDRAGMPADLVRNILDRARKLQSQLTESGETSPELRRSEAAALIGLADTLYSLGDSNAALEAASRSREILEGLTAIDPNNEEWQRWLSVSDNKIGGLLMMAGQGEKALEEYRKGLAIREKFAATGQHEWQRDVAVSYNKIGDVLRAGARREEALAEYRKGLEVMEKLAASEPGNLEWRRDLSVSHTEIGGTLMELGRQEEALAEYRKGLDIDQQSSDSDKGNSMWQRDLAVSHNKVGDVLLANGQQDAALEEYRKAQAIMEALAAGDASNAEWQRDLSVSYSKIGDTLMLLNRQDEALLTYRKGLKIAEKVADADQGNLQWQRDLSVAHTRIGNVLLRQGKRDEALAEYRAGLSIDEKLASTQPDDPQAQLDLAVSLFSLADSGDQPRANLARCLEIMRQLKGQGKLSASQASWIPTVEQRLAALPAGE
jgi:tetratricopeptide (TPR) repeat protein